MKNGMRLIAALAALALGACSGMRSEYPGREYRNDTVLNTAGKPATKLVVYLDRQVGELYVDGKKGLVFPVSTGIPGHSTPAGNFTMFAKELNNRSSLYGTIYNANGEVVVAAANTRKDKVPPGGYYLGASMPYTMRFTELCAFHEGIVPDPPALTSHGCIHLTREDAETIYRLCREGTPVTILAHTPPGQN